MNAKDFLTEYKKLGPYGWDETIPVVVEVNGEEFQVEQVQRVLDPLTIMIVVTPND